MYQAREPSSAVVYDVAAGKMKQRLLRERESWRRSPATLLPNSQYRGMLGADREEMLVALRGRHSVAGLRLQLAFTK